MEALITHKVNHFNRQSHTWKHLEKQQAHIHVQKSFVLEKSSQTDSRFSIFLILKNLPHPLKACRAEAGNNSIFWNWKNTSKQSWSGGLRKWMGHSLTSYDGSMTWPKAARSSEVKCEICEIRHVHMASNMHVCMYHTPQVCVRGGRHQLLWVVD